MVSATTGAAIVLLAGGAAVIALRNRIFAEPTPPIPGPVEPPPGALCTPEFEFETICLAVSQSSQDAFNRFMQYRVDYENLTDQSITFDLIGQFLDQSGQVVDLQPRRQTVGPRQTKQFTFNFIWVEPGFKEVNFFAWTSIDQAIPISKVSKVNTQVM